MPSRIDPRLIPAHPNLAYEKGLWRVDLHLVAGLDEVGRGALAGPVVAGAVILPPKNSVARQLAGVRDSKQMSARQRMHWSAEIKTRAARWGLGFSSATEIDTLGIIPATRLAMRRALEALKCIADHLLIDALLLPDVSTPQTSLLKGDARSLSIACASVIAKVARDSLMAELDCSLTGYGFARHKGYGTAAHRAAIQTHGPCHEHRHTFKLLAEV